MATAPATADSLTLPGFAKPIAKADVLSVLAFWGYGDSKAFIAESHSMSVKKVAAIIDAGSLVPQAWRAEAESRRRDWK
ncbi:hypothetical protein C5U62_31660 [Pseudomonas protegens]|uniref:Uncharacterized protein n=1 Tax=Pseudomonas protegens TaxID=380021 RepID=A0A2T6GBJ3_9PSED|nr:hypothetical protein [Pseudomonas protegens]PUA41522.1 hypothetical protein C5U62_31660 [Pseudomonas protegens]